MGVEVLPGIAFIVIQQRLLSVTLGVHKGPDGGVNHFAITGLNCGFMRLLEVPRASIDVRRATHRGS